MHAPDRVSTIAVSYLLVQNRIKLPALSWKATQEPYQPALNGISWQSPHPPQTPAALLVWVCPVRYLGASLKLVCIVQLSAQF